ncbi:hypothetical protein [Thermodesulfobium sp.]|jgi:succinate dehydrogenase / fumarate reductase cytochrome b subunit|uniref:Succinate dehydrogenase cytochrome b556 subunit n=1 Tax=Thermodesulfobium narugense TaxID=184064 RepID=A0A7C5KBT5_9BACT
MLRNVPELKSYKLFPGSFLFYLHRITGLLLGLYLLFHIFYLYGIRFADPSLIPFFESMHAFHESLKIIINPGVAFIAAFHVMNGLRIIVFEFEPNLAIRERQAGWFYWVIGVTLIAFLVKIAQSIIFG